MNVVKNEEGEVKVIDEKGNVRWLPEHIVKGVEGQHILKGQGLSLVPLPVYLPPVDEDKKEEENSAEGEKKEGADESAEKNEAPVKNNKPKK